MDKNATRRLVATVALIAALLGIAGAAGVVAGQSAPSSYYGAAVMEDGTELPAGTTIIAVVNDTVQDRIQVDPAGQYGGSGPEDDKLRVGSTDEPIRFYVEKDDDTWIEAYEVDENPSAGTEEFDLTFPEGTVSSNAIFEVWELEPPDITVLEGETFDLNATIANQVDEGTKNVYLRVDGEDVRTYEVHLGTDDLVKVEFVDVETEQMGIGDYTFGVYTEDDEMTGTLTVERARPNLTVSSLEPSQVTVTNGQTYGLSATVTNEGTATASQSVAYRVGSEEIATTEVTLEPDESTTISFTDVNSSQFGPGTYDHSVATENDTRSGSLTVERFEPAQFDISNLSPTEETVSQGTVLGVSATVANVGDETDTQQIRFGVNDTVEATQTVSLTGGESRGVSFDLDTAPLDQGTYAYSIHSQNDSQSGSLTVSVPENPTAEFSISDLEPTSVTADPGEPVEVSANVSNVGDALTTQQILLKVGGATQNTAEVSLSAGQSETLTLEIDTATLLPGSYEYVAASDNDSQSGSLTVDRPPRANFTVSNVEPKNASVSQGALLNVSASIQNVGPAAGTQQIQLEVEGKTVASQRVSLDSDATSTARLTFDTTTIEPGSYTHAVVSKNDSRAGNLTVEGTSATVTPTEPPQTNTTSGNETETSEEEDDDGELIPMGLLSSLFKYVLLPLALIYGILKGSAIYLGY